MKLDLYWLTLWQLLTSFLTRPPMHFQYGLHLVKQLLRYDRRMCVWNCHPFLWWQADLFSHLVADLPRAVLGEMTSIGWIA